MKRILYGSIILALIFTFIGCAPHPELGPCKEFETRGYKFIDLEPNKTRIVTWDVYEVDDFIGWDVEWGPADVKLLDPQGKPYSWKRTQDSNEGFETVFYFEAKNPLSGKWRMIFTPKSKKTAHFYIWMYACSDKEGAYKKIKK